MGSGACATSLPRASPCCCCGSSRHACGARIDTHSRATRPRGLPGVLARTRVPPRCVCALRCARRSTCVVDLQCVRRSPFRNVGMASLPTPLGSIVLRNRTLKQHVAVADAGGAAQQQQQQQQPASSVAAAPPPPAVRTQQLVSEVEGGDEEVERLAGELFGIRFGGGAACTFLEAAAVGR